MKHFSILAATAILALAGAASAQETLKVGSPAPGLDIKSWVKGEQTSLQAGNVYVVEFWATWCGPCRASIPHLTELQKAYGDEGLTIIGVSTDDQKTVDKVPGFVRSQGDKMSYTVAIDREGATQRAWMAAANKQGIPCAFVVDRKGKIAWIGNPHPQANEGFDETLKQVMSGRFDPKLQKQAQPALDAARSARKMRNWLLASKHYDEIVAMDANVFAAVGLEKFEMQLVDMDDRAKAYDYARNNLMGQTFASDGGALQMLAEKIAADPKIDQPKRDLDLALEAAEAARRINGMNDAKSLAVLAKVRYARGEVDQAVELQKQAYFSAAPKSKPEYKRVLASYQEAAHRASMSMNKP